MQNKRPVLIFTAALLTISLGILGGCKKEQKPLQEGAAAKATQQIETPKLAPPKGEAPQPTPQPAEPEAAPIQKAEQAGAVTLAVPPPPTPATVPPALTQPSAAAPLPQAAPSPAQPPATAAPVPSPIPPPALQAAPAQPPVPPPLTTPVLPPLSGATPPAPSAPSMAQPVPFVPSMVRAESNVIILLDASGSQSAPLGGREVLKFDLQKQALADVILQLKQTEFLRNVGIRVFGAQTPIDQHNCSDTTQIYPVSGPDLDAVQKALLPLSAKGEGPIAAALEAASKDFPAAANLDQVIVLIADGADTCGVDPCQTAKAIHTANPKTIVHVIGFDLSQEDIPKIECIATNSEGKFYLARNEHELRRWLDEAVNSTLPYNVRLTTVAGATPIPTTISILKAGTEQAIKTETSFGTKSLRLAPGTYDILVEYTLSPELKKPSKIIKGVEVLERTKVEQEINFDLGSVTVSAIDTNGKLAPATYQILKTGTQEKIADVDSGAGSATFFLTPGAYDIQAEQKEAVPEKITLTESGIEVKAGEALDRPFRFQKGTLALKGVTTQNLNIPFLFQIYKAGRTDQLIASGALGADGGQFSLSPGAYDIIFVGQDPSMVANPRTKVTGAVVTAAETAEIVASFEMGVVRLSAVDGQGKPVQAEFLVRTADTQENMGTYRMTDAKTPVSAIIPPGTYEITASSTREVIEPKPTVVLPNIQVTAATPVDQVARFVFGTMRIRGRNAKEQPLETRFTISKSGTDESVATAPPSTDWLVFQISPGRYNIKAENISSESDPKPSLNLMDILVEDGKQVSHEAIFTAGKLKVIGRGPNNKIITCNFKVYQYGADTELISGTTSDDWQVYDISPGNYYLEAGYVDPVQTVLLKKWINVKVSENEILELILRF